MLSSASNKTDVEELLSGSDERSMGKMSQTMQLITPTTILICTVLFYGLIFHQHTRFTLPTYNKHVKSFVRRNFRNAVLLAHLATGLMESMKWHFLTVQGITPLPSTLDLVLCIVQCFTNQVLVKSLAKGVPVMTRPINQAAGVMRLILSVLAWFYNSAAYHKASVKALNAFIYARLLISMGWMVMSKAGGSGTPANPQGLYNVSVFTGAVLAAVDGDLKYGAQMYVALLVAIAAFNKWISYLADQKDLSAASRLLVDVCVFAGYAELRTVRKRNSHRDVDKVPYDCYADGIIVKS